jgi:transposase-like protein
MRKIYTPNFKSKVAVDAIKAEHTMSELSSTHSVNKAMIQRWKNEAIAGLPSVFSTKPDKKQDKEQKLIEELYRQIGQLKVENDWLKKNL